MRTAHTSGLIVAASACLAALTQSAGAAFNFDELFQLAEQDAYINKLGPRIRATCYPADLPPEQRDAIIRANGALPPTLMMGGERFFMDVSCWTGDLTQGPSGRAQKARLTFSFPADGVTWGLSDISGRGANELNARLIATFGATGLDRGRELIRQSLASWRRFSGISYQEVPDDGSEEDQILIRRPIRGDVRIGSIPLGTSSGILAYNAFPDPNGLAQVGGSDMCINASYFEPGTFQSSSNTYRYFRNVVSHEHGHGLGFIHPVPCNNTKLMEPFASTGFEMVQTDEIRATAANYGDKYAGNQSFAAAKDFGSLTTPAVRSIIERNLSTNGAAGPLNTSEDWFKFSTSSTQNVVITIAPVGGNYQNGQQSDGCNGSISTVNAAAAGNLNVELRDSTGTVVLFAATSAAAGATETITANNVAPGNYSVRVWDAGPNDSANQAVQLYDMTIRVGTSKAAPLAIAGLNKRVAVNTVCYFFGSLNSRATETGGTISTYAWDLDGNGTFEIANNASPTKTYTTTGTVNVTLRCTDNSGTQGSDTITVEVFDPQTTFSVPGSGNIWLSAQPDGVATQAGDVAPAQSPRQLLDQPVFNSDELRFTVSGTVAITSGGPSIGPDGDTGNIVCKAGSPNGENSVGPICAPAGALIGVFMPSSQPAAGDNNGTAPLDFSSPASRDYTLLAPGLRQPFFIGNGLTSTNQPHRVLIPTGATRLFLGSMDTSTWSDNSGGFNVSVQETLAFPGPFSLLSPANASTVPTDHPLLQWEPALGASAYTVSADNDANFSSPLFTLNVNQNQLQTTTGTFAIGQTYYWKVTAINPGGRTTVSTPTSFSFTTAAPPPPCPGDINGDNTVNTADLTALLGQFGTSVPANTGADLNGDGVVNTADLTTLLGTFGVPCP